jgi:hypothetical protein
MTYIPYFVAMNRIILLLLLVAPAGLFGQSPMFGLYGAHHLQTVGTNGKLQRVNKPLAIIYNQGYCWFFTPNGDKVAFRTRSYTKTVSSSTKSIHESFVNQDSRTTADAFYHILIDQTDEGWTFQVSTPSSTLIVEGAQQFGENGKVPGMKIDWTAVKAGERKADSLQSVALRRDSLARSSLLVEKARDIQYHDSLIQVARSLNIFFRDDPPNSWLRSAISSRKGEMLKN